MDSPLSVYSQCGYKEPHGPFIRGRENKDCLVRADATCPTFAVGPPERLPYPLGANSGEATAIAPEGGKQMLTVASVAEITIANNNWVKTAIESDFQSVVESELFQKI
ncbi:MAG TPA: hypothetical protein VN622_04225 [Clostridia bacterium]|nr:hypothetical protein [Clostridia bacterium]